MIHPCCTDTDVTDSLSLTSLEHTSQSKDGAVATAADLLKPSEHVDPAYHQSIDDYIAQTGQAQGKGKKKKGVKVALDVFQHTGIRARRNKVGDDHILPSQRSFSSYKWLPMLSLPGTVSLAVQLYLHAMHHNQQHCIAP